MATWVMSNASPGFQNDGAGGGLSGTINFATTKPSDFNELNIISVRFQWTATITGLTDDSINERCQPRLQAGGTQYATGYNNPDANTVHTTNAVVNRDVYADFISGSSGGDWNSMGISSGSSAWFDAAVTNMKADDILVEITDVTVTIEYTPAGPSFSGTGAITASSSLSSTGTHGPESASGTSAVAATSSLSSTGVHGPESASGTGSIAAASSLSSTGGMPSQDFSGTGALSASASLSSSGEASIAGPPAPIVEYKFDEGSGTTIGDSSGNGYDYTNMFNLAWTTPKDGIEVTSPVGSAAVTVFQASTANTEATLACWFYVPSGEDGFFTPAGLGPLGVRVWADDTGGSISVNGFMARTFSGYDGSEFVGSLAFDEWHFLVARLQDAGTDDHYVDVFVDGVQVFDNPNHFLSAEPLQDERDVRIGAHSYASSGAGTYTVDDIRGYDTALTDQEIADLWSLGRDGGTPPISGTGAIAASASTAASGASVRRGTSAGATLWAHDFEDGTDGASLTDSGSATFVGTGEYDSAQSYSGSNSALFISTSPGRFDYAFPQGSAHAFRVRVYLRRGTQSLTTHPFLITWDEADGTYLGNLQLRSGGLYRFRWQYNDLAEASPSPVETWQRVDIVFFGSYDNAVDGMQCYLYDPADDTSIQTTLSIPSYRTDPSPIYGAAIGLLHIGIHANPTVDYWYDDALLVAGTADPGPAGAETNGLRGSGSLSSTGAPGGGAPSYSGTGAITATSSSSVSGTPSYGTSVFHWNGTSAEPSSIHVYDGSTAHSATVREVPRGYLSVAEMLAQDTFYWAHRGGSAVVPEMSLYAYTRAVDQGFGGLEVSLARTSDGVWFGLHDQTLLRTSNVDLNPTTMTWSEVQEYRIILPQAYPQPHRPYMRIEELVEAYGHSHVLIVDPKYQLGSSDELFDYLLSMMPSDRIIAKYAGNGSTLADIVRPKNIQSWGYYYEASWDTNKSFASSWDMLGMEWNASQATWDDVLTYGKPTVAHICATRTAADTAIAKGADGIQTSGIFDVLTREIVTW